MTVLVVWVPTLFASTILARREGQVPLYAFVTSIATLASLLTWRPSRRYLEWQAGAFSALVFIGLAAALLRNGPQPMGASAGAVWVAWTTLFFGWRGLTASLGALAPVYMFAWWRFTHGAVVPAAMFEATDHNYWLRIFPFLMATFLLAGLVVRASVRAFEGALRLERDAMAAAAHEETARMLAQAQAEVLQRRQIVGALASELAHDLNNVISVTSAGAEVLLEAVTDEERRAAIDQIIDANERATLMVRELLALGRSVDRSSGEFDGARVMKRVSQLIRRTLPAAITLECSNDAQCLMVGDELRFEQAVLNLALNARDAMPQGGTLAVSLRCASDAECRLDVRDTGVGIPPELREQIFTPFFSTKSATEGSGLGLAMVARVAQDMGGRVLVDSTIGEGSIFTVFWPRGCGDSSNES